MQQAARVFETRCISALEKVFADGELHAVPLRSASALLGEVYALQIAYRADRTVKPLKLSIESELEHAITARSVGLVPSELPCYSEHDDNVLRVMPGLYPDPLYPIEDAPLAALPHQWRSVWVTIDLRKVAAPGTHTIRFQLAEANQADGSEAVLGQETFTLEVLAATLAPQRLIHTEWFHADCLMVQYGVDAFSEAHWALIAQYVRTAADHGINMILTPLFTPPLDTAVGGERPTVQLIDVDVQAGGGYRFGFDKLLRWVQVCSDAGIAYYEFAHLFTQWGARHAPKIIATTARGEERIFGWETDAGGAEYRAFLASFLPELVQFLRLHGLEGRCYFHVSDEPSAEHLEAYRSAASIVHEHLADYPVIDALSDYRFYEQGLVRRPIPALDHLDAFLDQGVPDLWTYYCCAQSRDVSNRFFNMPSARNRIVGMQLYKYQIRGFLHWGYNFWFSQYSRRPIDPYRVTDAGLAFPSGDAFLVYPGAEGPIESIRLEVFYDALQDLRALDQLEGLIGRKAVLELLEEDLDEPITLRSYPRDPSWLLAKRQQVNRMIAAHEHERSRTVAIESSDGGGQA